MSRATDGAFAETVQLRPWRPGDARALMAARGDAADLQTQFDAAAVATEELARDFIAGSLGFAEQAKNWAVVVGIERAKLRYGEQRFDVETHARLATDPTPITNWMPSAQQAPTAQQVPSAH
ncbi:hypothetical protein [Nesterenkonia sandarakina]|uniref:hypothetical protein n=1 Tax=Nesterenkonia sandarakina TaxID=272918 RepID=UPI002158EA34|nr:hypothetical protein [Nesterenkonia sandarakina]